MNTPRYIFGNGEVLTGWTSPPPRGPGSDPAYTFDEALSRIGPMVAETATTLAELPEPACPRDEVVASLTLHPQALAKSYHPKRLLDSYNLRQIGSRAIEVTPEKWTKAGEPQRSPSTELYIAGTKADFHNWATDFSLAPESIHDDIRRLECVRAVEPEDRLRHLESASAVNDELLIELLIHASPDQNYILDGLEDWTSSLGVNIELKRRLFAGGLCFIPAMVEKEKLGDLAMFSFLRVARPLSQMRELPTIPRSVSLAYLQDTPLPNSNAVDDSLKVAVLDGGLQTQNKLSRWVTSSEPANLSAPSPALQDHGHDVTSAVLFGSLTPGKQTPPPFSLVDHYRVLDDQDGTDPFELYDVLGRIKAILSQNHYDFVNLSIGPAVCIEDDDIHPWTAVLDSLLSKGQTLLTIAAGNNGDVPDECDRRVQVPSDCVNALAVGAADSTKTGWRRAPYSAVGPGRAPGLVKPDLLDFGGSPTEPFLVTDVKQMDGVAATQGTSFASPCLLRRAIGLRTTYGEDLSPLVIKALLVHTADPGDQQRAEVGWGRVVPDMDSVMVCGDGEVRVIYQGRLEPGKYLRARVPLPPEELKGKVEIKATAVFATETDPEDPSNYSRAGLDIVFRPHCERFKDDAVDPVSRPFFRKSDFDTEATLRTDAHKWETALNSSDRMFGRSLKRPVFDIHYNARSNGGGATDPESIPYAFVVTVRSHATANLYEQVAAEFNQLRAVNPVTQQVRVQ